MKDGDTSTDGARIHSKAGSSFLPYVFPKMNESSLISPYGGNLVDLTVSDEERSELLDYANTLPSLQLSTRAVCDLELLATGAFSPLDRYMGKADFERVVSEMRLTDGVVFPIPVALPISSDAKVKPDTDIALCDTRNNPLAVMTVEEIYEWDRAEFSRCVLGTRDLRHPLNAEISRGGNRNISGKLRVPSLPKHFDFPELRLTPQQTRERLETFGNPNVAAFQTRNPLHRGHEEICRKAMAAADATLLMHPTVGLTREGDVDHFTRVRSYKALIEKYFSADAAVLAVTPLAMRMAGPREAVWHMLVRRNYGTNHFVVGRDHASPGAGSNGKPFYEATEAQEMALQFSDELGVKALTYDEIIYLPDEDRYEEVSKIENSQRYFPMSGTRMREDLKAGKPLPDWFARAEVADVLTQSFLPPNKQGVCVWFTGLSGAGKSTIGEILTVLLNENARNVTLLDGDVVRTHLSKGLGFSREDRDTNILRIGFVASEIVKHGGVAICAAVSPYRATRDQVRKMFERDRFIEVFVDTPISVCEQRDVKGLYAKARRGEIKEFTGIDDPYEPPDNADVILNNDKNSARENAEKVMDHLRVLGFVIGKLENIS